MEKNITLNPDEFISDHISDVSAGLTLINAGTGTGKTTFVLDHLAKRPGRLVLMVVPLVAQITQLSAIYRGRDDIAFISGARRENFGDLSGKNVVCTYDMLLAVRRGLRKDSEGYLLVVDEVHKLYSAGSYRSKAIRPILAAIKGRNKFSGCLMLTATYTQHMARLADWIPDTEYIVTKTGDLPRSLTVMAYMEPSPENWLASVLSRLVKRPVLGGRCQGVVLVRLNNCDRIDASAMLIENYGYKCMKVMRSVSGRSGVKEMLEAQAIPPDVDVVLTTSILDEAINFNNKEGDVDSVHIVDGSVHPEEIVQFLGRLRKISPPAFIHLNKDNKFIQPLDGFENNKLGGSAWLRYEYTRQIASCCKTIIQLTRKLDPESDIEKFSCDQNLTMRRHVGVDLVDVESDGDNVKCFINIPAILSAAYRADLSSSYDSYDMLCMRLKGLLPSISISLDVIKESVDMKNMMDGFKKIREEKYRNTVSSIMDGINEIYMRSDCRSLKEYAEHLESSDDKTHHENGLIFSGGERGKVFQAAIKLAQVLVEPDDIKEVLSDRKNYEVIKRDDGFSDEVEARISEALKIHCLSRGNHFALGIKLSPEDCEGICRRGFLKAKKRFPAIWDAISDRRNLCRTFMLNKNGKLVVNKTKAISLIASIATCDDKNSHKPEKRYLLVHGLRPMGLRFHRLEPLKPEELRDLHASCLDLETEFADVA